MSIITTQELDALARMGLNDLQAVFTGKMDDATLEKANMAIKLLRIGSGRYSAETNRMALAFRLARSLNVPKQDLVPLWRQLAGAKAAERAQKAIEAAASSGDQKPIEAAASSEAGKKGE